jgi:polyisoprenoid-binding protein YceI
MTTFQIDPAHTDVQVGVKHMMVTTVRGTFEDVSGTAEVDETDPTRSNAEIRIGAASVSTGVGPRDAHLRSADFLDAEQFPEIVIRTTAIRPTGGTRYEITAEATVRGVTRPVVLDAELLGFYRGMDGARRLGVAARAKVNRKDWGLDWNVALEAGGWLVGEEITFEIDLAFQELAAAVAA